MAELVDAHASGACWLSQWKFESSSGHQKPLLCGGVFGVLKKQEISGGSSTRRRGRQEYAGEALAERRRSGR